MRFLSSFLMACAFCSASSVAQKVNGLSLGMSKAEVCRFVLAHSAYHFDNSVKCPNLDDFVTVETSAVPRPAGRRVQLIFRNDVAHSISSTFPTGDFFEVLRRLTDDYGKPGMICAAEAGHISIRCGPYKKNKSARNVGDLLDHKLSADEGSAGMSEAKFTNGYLYWHIPRADIFLEQENDVIAGQMTGWFAVITPDIATVRPRPDSSLINSR